MKPLPTITALYKTFDGGEWIDASLASIYHDVDAIVMVHSATSWLGETGNNVEDAALQWQSVNDHDRKIHHLSVDVRRQEQQYAAGLEYIRINNLPADVVLAIDADEVWEPGSLGSARQQMQTRESVAYQISMHTYLRTPFYRVAPAFGQPVSLFRDPSWLTKCPRGCKAPSLKLDAWMHHFTYVRQSDADVERKLRQSCAADGGERVVTDWMSTTWKALPHGENLHAFHRWRNVWKRVQRVYHADLPCHVRNAAIMRQFWPEALLLDGEKNTLFDLTKGRKVAVDLGTFQGASAILLSLACDHVYTVDLFERVKGIGAFGDQFVSYEDLWEKHDSLGVPQRLSQFGNITLLESDTAAAASAMDNDSVDVLFVDADHSYEGTRKNWVSWWPKLTIGGLLIFHDDNDLHPGVQQVVRELRSNHLVEYLNLPETAGSLAALQKVSHV